jgi:deoxyribodipyrimidine photolyase
MSKTNETSTIMKIGILWFRNDLRLNDNNALKRTIDLVLQKKLDVIFF